VKYLRGALEERNETRRARLAVNAVQTAEANLRQAAANLETCREELRRRLAAMRESGCPREPWETWWRGALEMGE
jgi:hypothetical protein